MILHPAIIALSIDSVLTCAILTYAAIFALQILRTWDLASGSELQVELEHRTYLISTIMSICLMFQVASLFLFIQTTDSICRLFTGAMCAAGTLNLNHYGYPVLVLKLVTAFFSGIWLIVNHTDNQGYDYPLIKIKYRLLLLIAPLVAIESVLMGLYFLSLKPHVITSCCGSLFSAASTGGAFSTLISLPAIPLLTALFVAISLTQVCGYFVLHARKRYFLFSACCALSFVIGVVSLVVAIPIYIYALPTHHCPFCMLHREYGYVGYIFYASLLGGGVSGLGVGGVQLFRRMKSLEMGLRIIQHRLTISALILFALFATLTAWQVLTSALHV